MEVHCDAAFAAGGERSTTGLTVKYGGAPIFWLSVRQSTMAVSTAEAELNAQMEALTAGRSLRVLVEICEELETVNVIYNDNMAALAISNGTSGSWRTRHLRIRANALAEALENREWLLRHLDGRFLVADELTKALQGVLHDRFIHGLHLRGERAVSGAEVQVKSMSLGGGEKAKKALTPAGGARLVSSGREGGWRVG